MMHTPACFCVDEQSGSCVSLCVGGVGMGGGHSNVHADIQVTVYKRARVVLWLQDSCEAALVSLACQLTPSALHMKEPGCVGGQEKERTKDVEGGRGQLCIYLHLVGICIIH